MKQNNNLISNKTFNSLEEIKNFAIEKNIEIKKKYLKGRLFFIFLNLFSFSMTAVIVVLTMFVINNGWGGELVKKLFVTISILTAVISLFTGINTLFQFKKRKEIYSYKINQVKEIIKYINKVNEEKADKEIIKKICDVLSSADQNAYV